MAKHIKLTIDGINVEVPESFTIMQASDYAGVRIPRLCYHPALSTFGACRICVVEVEGMKNYPPACSTKVLEGMKVKTNTKAIYNSRKNILELILANHPSDCKLCRKSGTCTLQELFEKFSITRNKYKGEARNYAVDSSSYALSRDPDKCILCGKCIRVCTEVQSVNALTFSHRGFKTNVVPAYETPMLESVCINCGQCINVCPTGALVERDAIEDVLKNINDPKKTVIVQIAPAVRVAVGEGFGMEPGTDMTYETVTALRLMGFDIVFDTQFSADLTIIEEGHELIHRIKNNGVLPMMTSCSPGWIKFCEAFHPDFIDNLSTCKSPQQMMGALIKTYYAKEKGLDPENIYSVSIMPCTAKKFEAARPEMNSSGYQDVDAVLTTRELIKMIKLAGLNLGSLKKGEFDSPLGESSGAAPIFGATGGVMEAALRTAYEVLTGQELKNIDFTDVRGFNGIKEASVNINGIDVKVAVANGVANAHKILQDVETGRKKYHFIEVMTCPGGCLGGGGQPYPGGDKLPYDKEVYEKRAKGLYSIDELKNKRKSHENPDIKKIYDKFLKNPLGELSHKLLHTHYHARTPKGIAKDDAQSVNIFSIEGESNG